MEGRKVWLDGGIEALEDIDTRIAEAKTMSYRTEASLHTLAIICRVL